MVKCSYLALVEGIVDVEVWPQVMRGDNFMMRLVANRFYRSTPIHCRVRFFHGLYSIRYIL